MTLKETTTPSGTVVSPSDGKRVKKIKFKTFSASKKDAVEIDGMEFFETPHSAVILLTPEIALRLLQLNRKNRKIIEAGVQQIERDIIAGRWIFNGDTLKINIDLDMIDGQHRCLAVARAGRPVMITIVWGLDKEAENFIDTNRRLRKGKHVLELNGQLKYSSEIASAIRYVALYRSKQLASNSAVPNDIISMLFKQEAPDWVEEMNHVKPLCYRINSAGPMGAACHIFSTIDKDVADKMLDTWRNPTSHASNEPFYVLRSQMVNLKNKTGKTYHPVEALALFMKAFKMELAGQRPKNIVWTRGSKFPYLNVE